MSQDPFFIITLIWVGELIILALFIAFVAWAVRHFNPPNP